ncbi:F-box protein PP2-B13-like [Cornus florida]|uniref:F-box protein PP2-B13-like n=1 Tax=Cornus florida TaxID=4283 RepID=UPI00289900F1|nr:F-box protein PP2-B13-like [Cornus florida]
MHIRVWRERRVLKREKMGAETSRNQCPATDINALPENCIANVLSLTSPLETLGLSLVSSTFRSAAKSDPVWERFLPSDYQDIISRAFDSSQPVFTSKKELYRYLSTHHLIIDGGSKSFTLDKRSGKKCFMLAARCLTIIGSDTPMCWTWSSLTESRFTEVAELVNERLLEIRGKISTQLLSPDTTYAAYLVYNWTTEAYGFETHPVESWVRLSGSEGELRSFCLSANGRQTRSTRTRTLPGRMVFNGSTTMRRPKVAVAGESNDQYPKQRGDGWMEMELGKYLNKGGEDGELEICLQEVNGGHMKSGLILQGIEIRPKNNSK